MAHVKKYTQGALFNMLGHYDRTAKHSRENIDPSLTHLNYNLAEKWQPLPQKEFIDKRLSQVRVQKRKDVNVMCSWVLTAPKSLDPREYKRFFKAGYRFMERRYGRDNVISAYVHMDEPSAMPHMHFAFVPVLHDLEKGIDRLCAKKVVSRQDLKSFHNDLEAEISRSLGHGVEKYSMKPQKTVISRLLSLKGYLAKSSWIRCWNKTSQLLIFLMKTRN